MTATVTRPVTSIAPLSFALDHVDPELRDWLRTQPPTVRGVVDLALVEDNAGIVAAFAPQFAAALNEIAGALEALDAETTLTDSQWLARYGDGGSDRAVVEAACGRLRETVRVTAQLVASLIGRAA